MKTMSAVNAVQLFFLVWTFSAVCRADDDISVNCEDVTGTVSEEVTLTCSVSLKKSGCCFTVYKFLYPERYNDPTICKEFPQDSCEQRNSFTCRFTPTTAMKEQFRFFIQPVCGGKTTQFTVNITDTKPENKGNQANWAGPVTTQSPRPQSKTTVIAAVMGCFIFIIIIIMIIIYKKTPNYSKPCAFQRRIFQGHKRDDNNSSNIQEQNPDNVM
ncbi:uncharacterized protein LOC120474784 isoform X2 [Pimephales promelas]|uniref:uncharacterized protein LOC120474784 isoform X2 n=1 Tax=Pimephales promelas TaxID=90988 RepID=UPI001955502B|nr:uncharacterized protein LOC120474784 isoform X2 [Pimephales promelas]